MMDKTNSSKVIKDVLTDAEFHKKHEQIQYLSGLQPLVIFTF